MTVGPHTGARIRRARKQHKLTQQQLADKVGVSRNTVDAWENGRSYPKRYDVALEEVLGISLTDEPAAVPELTPADEWEGLVMADETLPYAERADLVRRSRELRARLYPSLEASPAHDGRAAAREDQAG